ncbi:hypothetical protein HER10_EVM0003891 [Colletotrichum scovillei]|uniref:Uncharacterized protein n=1 Tax=Colletotrichum scovillei TaxID=1209932 RepID=A0A9P7QUB9_9PEZI|nr:uncharacterized protein HER10_EVM0003891 [Colletotrichum scovillei]KAF4778379.1 hypothetical protein HER10_EVM0003891 [Colletotrichum scovillei]KAG7043669.1 hypothetical protein JMJ77_0011491 [Colletotrichum scovillei]KAG7045773.1 hypothetical protein JMJ78_0010844 [Colletotrichum scovillei]KAG7063118.1 hypothetical protein JMJ76_0005586 [Colletotrichum scovillei]
MCIKHLQFYNCPASPRPNAPKRRHRVIANILCSHIFPCPAQQWENRTSFYCYMCPGCSGETPAVPRVTPAHDEWHRDDVQDNAWAQSYMTEYSHSVVLWIRSKFPPSDVTNEEMSESWFRAFFMERRCKENDHRVGACSCEANGPLAFYYNPATAARKYLTDMAGEKAESDPRIQNPAMQNLFRFRHTVLSGFCQAQKLYFRGGLSHQPLFSNYLVKSRRKMLDENIRDHMQLASVLVLQNAEYGAGWTDAHTLETTAMSRRANLVKFMAEVLLHDNGISNSRFGLAVTVLCRIIMPLVFRGPSTIPGLDKLADIASSTDKASLPHKPFMYFVQLIQKYYHDRRQEWNSEVIAYKARRALIDSVAEDVDDWEGPSRLECPVCNKKYYDHSPGAMFKPFDHGARGCHRGEPMVRMKKCKCFIGKRCLFQKLTESTLRKKDPACPKCKKLLPKSAFRLIEATAGELLLGSA